MVVSFLLSRNHFEGKYGYCPQAGQFIHSFARVIHSFDACGNTLSEQVLPNMGDISDSRTAINPVGFCHTRQG
jgi:hypothetical protein